MTIREVFKDVAIVLHKDELYSILDNEADYEDNDDVKKLLYCYKMIISELNEEYVPLKYVQSLRVQNNRCEFRNLFFPVIEILSITYNGEEIDFESKSTYFSCNVPHNSYVQITYNYVPKIYGIYDEVLYSEVEIPTRILVFGIIREYMLLNGLYEEAVIYDERFRNTLEEFLNKKKKSGVMKRRGWY